MTRAMIILAAMATIWGQAVSVAALEAATMAQLTAALAAAGPGSTVLLAPGTYIGTATIPAGVTLRGAGYGKTILDSGAAAAGITLAGDGSAVSELAVRSQGGAGIAASGVKTAVVSGVLVQGGAVGMRLQKVVEVRVENCIVDGSLTGLAVDGGHRLTLVNNTFTRTDSVAISLTDVDDSAVFNNLVVHAGVATSVRRPGLQLRVDHNLYLALFAGKFDDQAARISLGPWRDVSGGFDAQSVNLPVSFRDAAGGDYQPVSTLDWNPGMPTTANWGVSSLGDFRAPPQDILGEPRPSFPGVGAREAARPEAVGVDGFFAIQESEGTKSAGVFTGDGSAVRYLFRDLPLPEGKYGFVLPSRRETGAPIPAGDYELRLVESKLRIAYRALTANNGVGTGLDESDPDSIMRVVFAPDNRLILGCGWSERSENVRARDLATGKTAWSLPGNVPIVGMCQGGDGLLYVLQPDDKSFALIRLSSTGQLQPWPTGALKLPVAVAEANGLAELAGDLYITSRDGKVARLSIATGELASAFTTTQPFHPVADRQRGLLWMICGGADFVGGTVTAFTSDGKVMHTLTQVANPLGVAVNGDRLAVANYDTGQVHVFDIRNPAAPVATSLIGRGDGPYGPVAADRFRFQKSIYTRAREVPMDLDEAGRLTLLDGAGRAIVFAADATPLHMSHAQFGNAPYWARFPGDESITRFFDAQSHVSWIVDAKKGTWQPEAYWGRPELNQSGNSTLGFFKHQGAVFGVMRYTMAGGNPKRSGFLFLRYDNNYLGKIVAFYTAGNGGLVVIRDEDQDGAITAADGEGTAVLDPDGKPVNAGAAMARFTTLEANGNLRSETVKSWIFKGVDAQGCPLYEFPPGPAFAYDGQALVSPYTFKPGPQLYSESVIAADGDLLSGVMCQDSPHGMGLSNSGAIDLARFRSAGTLRWYLSLNDYGPIQGVKQVSPGFILTSWGHQGEWLGLSDDGLSLGHLGFPAAANWSGYWLDHPDHYCLFAGNDGNLHILAGDYFLNGQHWLTLANADSYRQATYPFSLAAPRAAALAAQPPRTTFMQSRSEKPYVVVKKLPHPLPIDGDLEKWRRLGLTPQIVITPTTAGPGIVSANDCSAVIRVAYEGKDLYVQVLRFDDVPTFHQTIATGTHIQDTVEMMINGFHPAGFQFSVGRFSTDGEQIVRRRFFAGKLQLNLPAEVAPRVVQVLDNAEAVDERQLVEAATGENLAHAKVIVTEFKLPIDERTWAGSEDTLFPVAPGKGFWLGFMIDDNDAPGTNLQKLEVWPASFSTFSTKEDSAWVVFE